MSTKKTQVKTSKVEVQPTVYSESEKEDSSLELSEQKPSLVKKTTKKNDAPPPKEGAKKAPPTKGGKAGSKTPAKKSAPAKTTKKANSEEDEDESGNRFFKILANKIIPQKGSPAISENDLSNKGGRFKGRNPMQAAKKAFTGLCNIASKLGYEGECSYVFTIQETSQGSTKKEFPYIGERTKLENHQLVVKKDKETGKETEYFVKFSSKVKSYKPEHTQEAEKKTKQPAAEKKTASKSAPKKGKAVAPVESPSNAKPAPKSAQKNNLNHVTPVETPSKPAPKSAPKGKAAAKAK